MKTINYRADINGLRGLAVFVILIFHLNLGLLPGGYVGVDIFFVISGYLISKIIFSELKKGSFSLVTFYERRARRILPALVSVLIACYVVVYLQFYPGEVIAYAKSMIAAALFSANNYFYSTLGYFSPAAAETPLLHLWSLGIEEQFYILFPLLLMLLAKQSFRFLNAALLVALISSLLLSQWMLTIHPTAAFYLLPFRAFELLIGAFLALGQLPKLKGQSLPFILSALGFLFIVYSVFFFSEQTPFPGFSALLPCLGTGLVIWAGEERSVLLNKILMSKPWQWLGTISYSLYLVHWPIIVFAKRLNPYSDSLIYSIAILILCFSLASVNYYFVEQRFRYRQFDSEKVLRLSVLIISLVAVSGSVALYKKGFKHNQDTRIDKILAFLQYDHKPAFRDGSCFQDYDRDPDKTDISSCLPKGPQEKTIMLWGDSHAAHLYAGLKEKLEAQGYSVGMLSASACPPALNLELAVRPYCKRFNDLVMATILKIKPKLLILSANWPMDDSLDLVEKTTELLAKENIEMVLLGPSPMYKLAVPFVISEQMKKGELIKSTKAMIAADYLTVAERQMQKRFGNKKGLRYISVMNTICIKQKCPLITADGTPVYFDATHLTEAGSILFAKKLVPLILKTES